MFSAISDISASAGVAEQGTGYIRYNNGIQICWGSFDSANCTNTTESWSVGRINHISFNSGKTGVTFSKAFLSKPNLTISQSNAGTSIIFLNWQWTTTAITGINLWRPDSEYYGFGDMNFIAIGMWK